MLGFRIVNLWNSTPEEIVSAPSVNSFPRDVLIKNMLIYVTPF